MCSCVTHLHGDCKSGKQFEVKDETFITSCVEMEIPVWYQDGIIIPTENLK